MYRRATSSNYRLRFERARTGRNRCGTGFETACRSNIQTSATKFSLRQLSSFFRGGPAAANVPWIQGACGNLLEKLSPPQALTQLAELEASQEQHRQQVRQRQKERAAKFEAIAEGASHVAYSTLKQLRPWQPQQRAQLKNRDGKLMGPVEELEVLGEYAVSTFGAHEPLPERTGPLPHLDPQLLAKHIRSIKPHKAVPAPRRRPPGSFALTKLAPLSAPS